MSEVKTKLVELKAGCIYPNRTNDSAYIIESHHTLADVVRFLLRDPVADDLMYLIHKHEEGEL